jgi:hypothetical protein
VSSLPTERELLRLCGARMKSSLATGCVPLQPCGAQWVAKSVWELLFLTERPSLRFRVARVSSLSTGRELLSLPTEPGAPCLAEPNVGILTLELRDVETPRSRMRVEHGAPRSNQSRLLGENAATRPPLNSYSESLPLSAVFRRARHARCSILERSRSRKQQARSTA